MQKPGGFKVTSTQIGLLPVGIAVDGACALTGVEVGTITEEPVELSTGDHDVKVYLAGEEGCTGVLAFTGTINVSRLETGISQRRPLLA